jgi:ABC-2 type transport system ATP-binding protein
MSSVLEVTGLRKSYKSVRAVADISFSVEEGEVFGIVGPNGAGKTTTVECIEGLREPDGGLVSVLGLHPRRQSSRLKQLVGIQLQESRLPDRIRVWEALSLFGSFYEKAVPWRFLVQDLGLAEKANSYYDHLSGGQKQRLSIAMALVNDPRLVFFDELTTGLDPQSRRTIWDLVRSVRERGKTIVLVTHFMEEAQRLCDRVAIIDYGKLIALDTPRNLIKSLGSAATIRFSATETELLEALDGIPAVMKVEIREGTCSLQANDLNAVGDIIKLIAARGLSFHDFTIEQPNLEDVFLALTGRGIRD